MLHFYSNCDNILFCLFFFFNDTATTEIYTLSLHDALPISPERVAPPEQQGDRHGQADPRHRPRRLDRKSTRLNSSHSQISYAVFCLKKKNKNSISVTSRLNPFVVSGLILST